MSFKVYTSDDFNLPKCRDKKCKEPAHANSGIHQLCLNHYEQWVDGYREAMSLPTTPTRLLCAGCGFRYQSSDLNAAEKDGWIIHPTLGGYCPGCEPKEV